MSFPCFLFDRSAWLETRALGGRGGVGRRFVTSWGLCVGGCPWRWSPVYPAFARVACGWVWVLGGAVQGSATYLPVQLCDGVAIRRDRLTTGSVRRVRRVRLGEAEAFFTGLAFIGCLWFALASSCLSQPPQGGETGGSGGRLSRSFLVAELIPVDRCSMGAHSPGAPLATYARLLTVRYDFTRRNLSVDGRFERGYTGVSDMTRVIRASDGRSPRMPRWWACLPLSLRSPRSHRSLCVMSTGGVGVERSGSGYLGYFDRTPCVLRYCTRAVM